MKTKQTDIFPQADIPATNVPLADRMRPRMFALAAMILMAASALHAQEAPKVRLEKIYTFDKEATGNPLPAIQQAFDGKAKGVPQEDIDWALNSVRLDIARKTKVLYTNDGQAIKLPEDTRGIIASKNLKYFIVYADNQKEWEQEKMHGELGGKMLEYGHARAYYDSKARKAQNEVLRMQYEDSIEYYSAKYKEAKYQREHISDIVKIVKHMVLIAAETGKILWDISTDEIPGFISDDGSLIVSTKQVGEFGDVIRRASFYDKQGKVINEQSNLNGWPGVYDLSADGELFAMMNREQDGYHVIGFDKAGQIKWNTKVPGAHMYINACFAVSNYSNSTVISLSETGKSHTVLINNDGVIVTDYNCEVKHPSFSYDGKYLLLPSDERIFYLCDVTNGAIIYQKTIQNLDVGKTANMPLENKYVYVGGYYLNMEGNVLDKLESRGVASLYGSFIKTDGAIFAVELSVN